MSTKMSRVYSKFWISVSDKPAMLAAIKKTFPEKVGKTKSLRIALKRLDWQTETDKVGNVIDLTFLGDSMGDESELFETIAPWVHSGSYIELVLETGDYFAYQFHKRKLTGTVIAKHYNIGAVADNTVNLPEMIEQYESITKIETKVEDGEIKIVMARCGKKSFEYSTANVNFQKTLVVTGGMVVVVRSQGRYQFYFLAEDGKNYLMSDTKRK